MEKQTENRLMDIGRGEERVRGVIKEERGINRYKPLCRK